MEAQVNLRPKQFPPERMTLEEFLQWTDEEVWAEWINGEVRFLSPVSDQHADLNDFFRSILRIFVERHRAGIVRGEPFVVRLPGVNVVYSPDVFFLSESRRHLMRPTYLDGAPDLVVEIVSPESQLRDKQEKLANYQKAGVLEYWLIGPTEQVIQVYTLAEDGLYHPLHPDGEGRYHSAVIPGFWVRENWLWQRPLPDLLDVADQWGMLSGETL